jgi:hypothetical protein
MNTPTLIYSTEHRGVLIRLFQGSTNIQALVVYLGKTANSRLVDRIYIRKSNGRLFYTWTGSGAFDQAMRLIS